MNDKEQNKDKATLKERTEYIKKLMYETPQQRAIAYIRNLHGMEGGPLALSEKEIKLLALSFCTPEEAAEANHCIGAFNVMFQYSRTLEAAQNSYKAEAARLAGMIEKYETIKILEALLKQLLSSERNTEALEKFTAKELLNARIKLDKEEGTESDSKVLFGTRLVIGGEKETEGAQNDYLTVEGLIKNKYTKRLFKAMREQGDKVERAAAIYKSKLLVIEEFIVAEKEAELWCRLTPSNLAEIILYPDELEEKKRPELQPYFKANIRKREERGEKVTAAEKKLALFPDFERTRAIKEIKEDAADELDILVDIWYKSK